MITVFVAGACVVILESCVYPLFILSSVSVKCILGPEVRKGNKVLYLKWKKIRVVREKKWLSVWSCVIVARMVMLAKDKIW